MNFRTQILWGCAWFWQKFRYSRAWCLLRQVTFLRSGLYLAIELRRTFREAYESSSEEADNAFRMRNDPWDYETSAMEHRRFLTQTELLDAARGAGRFQSGLEIGCAEGFYTEVIAERCETLLVLDIAPTALARTQNRRQWPQSVRFGAFDLAREAIPGTFDLVIVAGVLEYFSRPTTFRRVRENLVAALRSEERRVG